MAFASVTQRQPEIVVAGHICLDVIPQFVDDAAVGRVTLSAGRLVRVGPSLQVTGGAVANTGLALHKLGIPTRLIAKLGDDSYGHRVLEILKGYDDPLLFDTMIVDEADATSYTIVISPPGTDRIFLHCSGANDTFAAKDLRWEQIGGARLFHFGYPPLMRRIYEDEGAELSSIFALAKSRKVMTSLDMSAVDPLSEAGSVDWEAWLRHVLPMVDVFLPSLDELVFMLDRKRSEPAGHPPDPADPIDAPRLALLSFRCLEMGATIVAIKLGDQGLYLRTASHAARFAPLLTDGPSDPSAWSGREIWSPCYRAEFRGATGAGDCTIAGFLASFLRGHSPTDVINAAVAVGACSVEAPDATGGIVPWHQVQQRLDAGWSKHDAVPPLPGWRYQPAAQVWLGPDDPGTG